MFPAPSVVILLLEVQPSLVPPAKLCRTVNADFLGAAFALIAEARAVSATAKPTSRQRIITTDFDMKNSDARFLAMPSAFCTGQLHVTTFWCATTPIDPLRCAKLSTSLKGGRFTVNSSALRHPL